MKNGLALKASKNMVSWVMDIRSTLRKREKESYDRMSPGERLKRAIELSELVQNLGLAVKAHAKRIQRNRKGLKRS